MSNLHAGSNGGRKSAVQHASLGCLHGNGACSAIIVGDIRIKHALHGHMDIGICEIVDHIATPIHLRGRPVKIDDDVASLHLNGHLYKNIILAFHLFHNPFCRVNAIWDLFDSLPHTLLGATHNLIRQIIQGIQIILLEHLTDLLSTHMIRCDL